MCSKPMIFDFGLVFITQHTNRINTQIYVTQFCVRFDKYSLLKMILMPTLSYELDINAPIEKVFEYYTDPSNIKESWPSDIVKESAIVSGAKGEKGSVFRIKGQYLGKHEEMRVQVIERWPNKKFITKQIEGPFKKWESTQEFQDSNNATHIRHTVEYELPMTGKIVSMVSGKEAENKIRTGLEQAGQTVKNKMESG